MRQELQVDEDELISGQLSATEPRRRTDLAQDGARVVGQQQIAGMFQLKFEELRAAGNEDYYCGPDIQSKWTSNGLRRKGTTSSDPQKIEQ